MPEIDEALCRAWQITTLGPLRTRTCSFPAGACGLTLCWHQCAGGPATRWSKRPSCYLNSSTATSWRCWAAICRLAPHQCQRQPSRLLGVTMPHGHTAAARCLLKGLPTGPASESGLSQLLLLIGAPSHALSHLVPPTLAESALLWGNAHGGPHELHEESHTFRVRPALCRRR